jgi:curved DNA-binding protein CbpA
VNHDPFALLGLPARSDLSDDDVRAAWRRVAAATHPDRDDGGDPPRFGAAAAAYALLRTADGRGEALADLAAARGAPRSRRFGNTGYRATWRAGAGRRGSRRRHGSARRPADTRRSSQARPIRALALRMAAATAVAAAAFFAADWSPSSIGVLTGALTWLLATTRHDLTRQFRRLNRP